MIPYYRRVRDTDDGCCIDQCLMCHATWEWRGGSGIIRYCMYCGNELKGEHISRDHDMPRWQWEYGQRHGENALYRLLRDWMPKRKPRRVWNIEDRLVMIHRETWNVAITRGWRRTYCTAETAVDALGALKRLRAEQAESEAEETVRDVLYRTEFRAIREIQ
jgi:hypothetical protein